MIKKVASVEEAVGPNINHVNVETWLKNFGAIATHGEFGVRQSDVESLESIANDGFEFQGPGTLMDFNTFLDKLREARDTDNVEEYKNMLRGRVFSRDSAITVFVPEI